MPGALFEEIILCGVKPDSWENQVNFSRSEFCEGNYRKSHTYFINQVFLVYLEICLLRLSVQVEGNTLPFFIVLMLMTQTAILYFSLSSPQVFKIAATTLISSHSSDGNAQSVLHTGVKAANGALFFRLFYYYYLLLNITFNSQKFQIINEQLRNTQQNIFVHNKTKKLGMRKIVARLNSLRLYCSWPLAKYQSYYSSFLLLRSLILYDHAKYIIGKTPCKSVFCLNGYIDIVIFAI